MAFVTAGTFGNLDCDYPTDPRQSTLANWLRWSIPVLGQAATSIEALHSQLAEQEAAMAEASKSGDLGSVSGVMEALNSAKNEAARLKDLVEAIGKTLGSYRIPASLDRFEKSFKHFLSSQNIRWLLVDVLFPLGLAATALVFLTT